MSPSCAYEVSCRVRAPPNGKNSSTSDKPISGERGDIARPALGRNSPQGKPRGLTGDGFPAAVPAFLLIGAPGPEWTAFGAVGPEVQVQVRPRGTATSATIQTSATNCHPFRNRHNGCITTGKVARTDPFPQIAAGAGQPRGPAGRSTESRRPFHPFGAAITRCFTAIPAPLTPTHHRQALSTMHVARNPGWVVSAGSGGSESGAKPWEGTVHRGRPSAARGWAPSRHRAARTPARVAAPPVVVRGGDHPGASTADA